MAGIGEIGVNVTADTAQFTAGMDRVAQVAETSMRRAEQAQRVAQAASDKFITSLQYQADTFGKTDAEILRYKANLLGASDAAKPLIAQLEAMAAATGAHAGSVQSATEATHKFSLESTGAKRELLVLAHELSQGNFKKFGGSMLVLGEQTGAAGLLFSATGLAALGFAAIIAGLAVAFVKGAEDQRAMNNALIETGNYAGTTGDALNAMAHDAAAVGGSLSEAKKAVTDLAGSGKFTKDEIGQIADAAIAMEHATGKAVDDTIKSFEQLAVQTSGNTARATEAISKAALKLDDQYHFLTESVYEQIRAFEKDGDQKAASALAIETLAKVTKDRAEEMALNIGTIESNWKGVKAAIGQAVDALEQWGQKATPATAVKTASFKLDQFDQGSAAIGITDPDKLPANLAAGRMKIVMELTAAVSKLNEADAAANAEGQARVAQSEANHAASRVMQDDTRLEKKGLTELQIAIKEYRADLAKIAAVNADSPLLDPAAVNAHIAALTKAHTATTRVHKDDPSQIYLTTNIKDMEASIARENTLLKTREQYISASVSSEYITVADGLAQKRQAIADDYTATQALYAKEAAAVQARKGQLNPATDKKKIAEEDKLLADIDNKRTAAAQASSTAMIQATSAQFKIQSDFDRATVEWTRQQGLANDQAQFSIDLMGKNTLEAQQLTNARKIYLDVEERIRLLKKQDPNADTTGLTAARDAQIQISNGLIAQQDAMQKDPWFNARESIRKYGEEAENVGTQIGATMTNSFKGAEDAFVTFVTTGKLSFASLATSIIADLARIQAKKAIAGLIDMAVGAISGGGNSSILSADSGLGSYNFSPTALDTSTSSLSSISGARAGGGSVSAGASYLVGEKGPEIFTPPNGGTIIPNGAGGSGGGVTINLTTQVSSDGSSTQTSGSGDAQARAMGDALNSKVKQLLVQETQQGGIIWKKLQGRG